MNWKQKPYQIKPSCKQFFLVRKTKTPTKRAPIKYAVNARHYLNIYYYSYAHSVDYDSFFRERGLI